MRVTILGCGTSGGVPRIGDDWGVCDPNEPKNRRRRCSILLQDGASAVLVDTSPDLRQQLLDARIDRLDAVLWTHAHADQVHGIDDLRAIAIRSRKAVECYAAPDTVAVLKRRFNYCFEQAPGSIYPAILKMHALNTHPMAGRFHLGQIPVQPFEQNHGDVVSLGFRFGPIGYSNDVVELSDQAFDALAGVEVWIVDAMRRIPHPTHAHLERTLSWIARLKPKRAVLTNMHTDMDYQTLRRELPAGVEPGFDGMTINSESAPG
jgi:phosphoribosyl 1,2-cyclic phosphate phosphodiesterase